MSDSRPVSGSEFTRIAYVEGADSVVGTARTSATSDSLLVLRLCSSSTVLPRVETLGESRIHSYIVRDLNIVYIQLCRPTVRLDNTSPSPSY